jgi:uncharacterized protein YndB with AHSA1/START domain
VFAAFEQPDQLARWWGPKDFTKTFGQFEFKPGGRWVFVMRGPNVPLKSARSQRYRGPKRARLLPGQA